MTARPYLFSTELKIWVTSSHDGTSYSDGDAIEHRLLSALKQCSNVSVASEELRVHVTDWPSEYHLSPARHNLLRPFTFGPSDSILELGCGCGAMTRYLGETGAKVVAVEGSRRRAAITAERCRDLPNVSVYCDNLIDFQADAAFDFVTLIGVLEYSNQFISGTDPVNACLMKAGSFLTEDGALILAIENQLGLKYFNGCNEDHLGIPYFGINGLYGKGDPVTFGRHVLVENLRQAGFPFHEFFYPSPDYKLPCLILSEAALRDDWINIADLLIHNTGANYPETGSRAFAEDLAWSVVADNKLVADLANSFLIFARLRDSNTLSTHWLAKMYGRGRRHSYYQVESTIEKDQSGRLMIRKQKIHAALAPESDWLVHAPVDNYYITGSLLIRNIHASMVAEEGIIKLAESFNPWIKFLLANVIENSDGKLLLPGRFIDCIPANIIIDQSNTLHYFDDEWISKEPIPFDWIVIRGISDSLSGCFENRHLDGETLRTIVSKIYKYSSISLNEDAFSLACVYEDRLASKCFVNSSTKQYSISAQFDNKIPVFNRIESTSHELESAKKEILRLKNTVSWRITKPLRGAWNLIVRPALLYLSPKGQ